MGSGGRRIVCSTSVQVVWMTVQNMADRLCKHPFAAVDQGMDGFSVEQKEQNQIVQRVNWSSAPRRLVHRPGQTG